MQYSMYDVKRCFYMGLKGVIFLGHLRADKNLSQKLLIYWKSDTIGR
jgi:hypothetical protein